MEPDELKNQLQTLQKRIIELDKMSSLGLISAGIAHEIKNPLNFINNFSGINADLVREFSKILKHEESNIPKTVIDELNSIAQDIIANSGKIQEHARRADQIVSTMLLHSRNEFADKTETDINSLLSQAIKLTYHGIRAINTNFNVTLEEEYDFSPGKIKVVISDINRVFLNILNNAMYAAYEKSIKNKAHDPLVTVKTYSSGSNAIISIKDNGDGVKKENIDKLFTPFFTTKPAGSGTGLGLYISHDIIVKGHGGSIKVNTKEGEFCEFIISLPA